MAWYYIAEVEEIGRASTRGTVELTVALFPIPLSGPNICTLHSMHGVRNLIAIKASEEYMPANLFSSVSDRGSGKRAPYGLVRRLAHCPKGVVVGWTGRSEPFMPCIPFEKVDLSFEQAVLLALVESADLPRGLKATMVESILKVESAVPSYNTRLLRKRSGGYRTICIPDRASKCFLRFLNSVLVYRQNRECFGGAAHGFVCGRNSVTNALAHVGYEYTLSVDLKDFFDTVLPSHLPAWLKKGLCLWEGGPVTLQQAVMPTGRGVPQGFPTSPTVANMAAVPMDLELLTKCESAGIAYTRYADDLTFSSNSFSALQKLYAELPELIGGHKFVLNLAKTRWQWAGAGRRIITGVAVDRDGVCCTRETRRKLRVLEHKNMLRDSGRSKARVRGMSEWAECKTPKYYRACLQAGLEVIRESTPGMF